jgi:CHAT domain-containing protein
VSRGEKSMKRVIKVAVLLVLGCAVSAAEAQVPIDPRAVKAQRALEEGLRLAKAGQYAEAMRLYKRALLIAEAAVGKDHPEVTKVLNPLANLYMAQGQYEEAVSLRERALAITEAAPGKDPSGVAAALNNLAYLYVTQGQYARAEPLFDRALTIWEAAPGKEHLDVATALNNLAHLYKAQGNYEKALPLFKRALEIAEAAAYPGLTPVSVRGSNSSSPEGQAIRSQAYQDGLLATALNNLADLYEAQEQYAQAEPLYQRALEIREKSPGKDHLSLATALNNLAHLYMSQRQYARAEPLYQRALETWEAAPSKHHPNFATTLSNLALLYMMQGQYARAKPLFDRALMSMEAVLGKQHPYVARVLYNQASLHLSQQRLEVPLPLLQRALNLSEQHLRQEVFGYSEARMADVLRQSSNEEVLLYALVQAYPEHKRVRHLALTAALLRKGRSLEELAITSHILYRGLGPGDRQALERLRDMRAVLAALALTRPEQLSPAVYQQRLKSLTEQGDALEASLARRSGPLRSLYALPPPDKLLAHVAAALPKDGVLVEFVASRYSLRSPTPGSPAILTRGELHYLALLLFHDGRTHAVDLGPAEPLDTSAQRFRSVLANPHVAYEAASQELYALAFQPLVPHLGKAQRLFLSPEGQLSLIPFAALHDGHRFLLESWDITYLTSGKDLLRRPENSPQARSVVVLADPDFSARPAAPAPVEQASLAERLTALDGFFSTRLAERSGQVWASLPGTKKEAEAIQRLFPQTVPLLGADATKAALLKVEDPLVLHIATHGFFLEDAPPLDDTRTVGTAATSWERVEPLLRSSDPLLRSGLVLAGGSASNDSSGSTGREDSWVTALELAGLDLWGTQLVVLSACDTGRGDVKLGQGVYGLRRALLIAGAETVVTSLWRVNDDRTGDLMTSYYQHLQRGQGRVTALREAMKALRQKEPHPYYWAPFIAIGQDSPLRDLVPAAKAQTGP